MKKSFICLKNHTIFIWCFEKLHHTTAVDEILIKALFQILGLGKELKMLNMY